MKKITLALALIAGLGLTACQSSQWGTKQTMGTGLGAVAGGLAGAQLGKGSGKLWATGLGVLIGALAGSEVGASLDAADRMYMQKAQDRAYNAPIGEQIARNNPRSGNQGTYKVVRDGTSSSGLTAASTSRR